MNFRYGKTLAGIALSFTLLTGGILAVNSPAHAAETMSPTAANIISTGERFMGVPYQWGAASGRTDRFDCSSFTQYVFGQNGIKLPRSSKQQLKVGVPVSRDQLQPGDLVFFYNPVHHVAIYIGNGKLLHTFGKGGVTITNLNTGWWNTHYTTARHVLPS
ncbi:C40 family peptidase [Cohnella zeiphila]|uniref:C40 family peptidase n=1 Tax=Cohnella zeiphila TaxID=2761120 RepID=A0A7X0SMG7_9BACL|nr:C40 family peptidase [Cohnella zeiphila]MBB6732707.1 C40 family peptidase [Cohnella zeiphila]